MTKKLNSKKNKKDQLKIKKKSLFPFQISNFLSIKDITKMCYCIVYIILQN